MLKPILVVLSTFALVAQAEAKRFVWVPDQGFQAADECTVKNVGSISIKVARQNGEKLLSLTGSSSQGLLTDRALVRSFDGDRVKVVSQSRDTEVDSRYAKLGQAGKLQASSLKSLSDYVLEITSDVDGHIASTGVPLAGSFWEIETNGSSFETLECNSKLYLLFNVTVPSRDEAVAEVGLPASNMNLLSSVKVETAKEAGARVSQIQKTGSNVKTAAQGSAAVSKTSFSKTNAPKAGAPAATKSASRPAPKAPIPSTPNPALNAKGKSKLTGAASTQSGSAAEVLCADQPSGKIFLRDDKLNVLSSESLVNGAAATRISTETKKSGSTEYAKINVSGEHGWVSTESLKSDKSLCPSLNPRYVCTPGGAALNFYSGSKLKQTDTVGNLERVSSLGQTRSFKKMELLKVQYGSDIGWVSEKDLVNDPSACSSGKAKPTTPPPAAPAKTTTETTKGPVVSCLENKMEDIPGFFDCGPDGRCWGHKNKYKSRALCARFTKVGILDCKGSTQYIDCAEAKNCGPGLIQYGYTKLDSRDPHKAPFGAAIIYDGRCGNPAGHIEIKVKNNQWISDFIERVPRSETTKCRPVKAIYFKP